MYITYISVSNSTPLAVTGPHGQLASTGYSHRIRIGPDRAYPLHFTPSQLLQLLHTECAIAAMKLERNSFLLPFWALSFEMITFQPLIIIYSATLVSKCDTITRSCCQGIFVFCSFIYGQILPNNLTHPWKVWYILGQNWCARETNIQLLSSYIITRLPKVILVPCSKPLPKAMEE